MDEVRHVDAFVVEVDEATNLRWIQEEVDSLRAYEDELTQEHARRISEIRAERQEWEERLEDARRP